jgi:hypothetical protein
MLTPLLCLALASAPPPALPSPPAPMCITLDRSADKLSDGERQTAMALIEQAVAATGGRMAAQGCSDPLALSHVKVGEAVSVALRGPGGARFAQASGLQALPEVYARLFQEATRPQPAASPAQVALVEQHAETPEPRSSVWFGDGHGQFYARLGYNGTAREGLTTGPSLGLGYRRELGNLMFDVSSLNMNLWRQSQYDSYNGTWNAYLRLMAFRYLSDLLRGADLYAGAGFSYGETKTPDGMKGQGIQGDVGFGYELLRHTVLRSFLQVVATFPFYQAFKDEYPKYVPGVIEPSTPTRTTGYAFTVAASIGVGF